MGDHLLAQPDQKAAIIQAAAALATQYREMHEDDKALLNPEAFIQQIKRNYIDNENNQHISNNTILSAIDYVKALMDEINACRQNQRVFRFTNAHLHRGRRWIDQLDRFRAEERKTANQLIAKGAVRWAAFALGFVSLFALAMFFPMVGGALFVGLVSVMVFEFAFKKHWFKGPLHLATSAAEKYKQGSLLKKHRVGVSLGLAKLFPRLDRFANRERPRAMHPYMGYLNQKIRPSIAQVEATYQAKKLKTQAKLKEYSEASERLIDFVADREGLDYVNTLKYIERNPIQEPTIHALYHTHVYGQQYYEARLKYLDTSLTFAKRSLQKETDEQALAFDVSLSADEKASLTERIEENDRVLSDAFVARPDKSKFIQAYSFFANPANRSVYPKQYLLPDIADHRECERQFPFERDRRYHINYAKKS